MEPASNTLKRVEEVIQNANHLYENGAELKSIDNKIYTKALQVLLDKLSVKFPNLKSLIGTIEYQGVKKVTFRDSSLDCPIVGKVCTQSLVAGYSISFLFRQKVYHVHTDGKTSYRVPEINFLNYSDFTLYKALRKAHKNTTIDKDAHVEVLSTQYTYHVSDKGQTTFNAQIDLEINAKLIRLKTPISEKEYLYSFF